MSDKETAPWRKILAALISLIGAVSSFWAWAVWMKDPFDPISFGPVVLAISVVLFFASLKLTKEKET